MKKNILLLFMLFIVARGISQNTNCSFGLELSSVQAEVGDTIIIDLSVRQFNEMLAMQYTHQWNPDELEFIDIIHYPEASTGINAADLRFGDNDVANGRLNFSYFDPTVQGVTIDDNTVLYSLRFYYQQPTQAGVQINGALTAMEFVDLPSFLAGGTIENYYLIQASVTTMTEPVMDFLSINTACLTSSDCSESNARHIDLDTSGDDLSYNWTGPNGFNSTTHSIGNIGTGHFQLELSQSNGQYIISDFYLGSPSSSNLNVNFTVDNDQCGNPDDGAITATVSGGSGNYTYQWSNGATSPTLTVLPAGVYTLTVTDNETTCTIVDEVEVESLIALWVTNQTTTTTCSASADGAIDITVDGPSGTAPFTFEWSNGATTEDLTNIGAGFYTVTITTDNGCSSSYDFFVEAEELLHQAIITEASCENTANGSIVLDIEEDAYEVLWSTGATSLGINDLVPGNYAVTLTNASTACVYEYELEAKELLVAYNILCENDFAELRLVVWEGDDAPYTFDWSTGEQTTSEIINSVITTAIDVPQNGTYATTITGASGCTHFMDPLLVDCADQPMNISLNPAFSSAHLGDEFCLDVKADEFINQFGFQLTLEWDESLLDFMEVIPGDVPSFTSNSYSVHLLDDGLLPVLWTLGVTGQEGVSLPNDATLFSVCFEAITDQEVETTVRFENFPTPIEFVNFNEFQENVQTHNAQINLNTEGGSDQLEISIEEVEANQGSIVCVPVVSSDFQDLGGMQMSMRWDRDALVFNSIQSDNFDETNFGSFVEAELDGVLRFLWLPTQVSGASITNNTTLFEVCYTAQGEEGTYPIIFSTDPIPAIAGTKNAEQIDLLLDNGSVTIGEALADEPFALSIASAAVDAGGNICLPVYADYLQDLLAMQFSINWDTDLLDFDTLLIQTDVLNINSANFGMPEAGALTFTWNSSSLMPVSVPTGEALFELCFTANQQQGVANVHFSNNPTAIEFVNENFNVAGFIPTNGQVTITTDGLVWPGDTDISSSVNHFDLLNIGLAYGATGPARINPNSNWLAQFAEEWQDQTPLSNVNFRYVDADGNGIINEADVEAIEHNWDETTENYTNSEGLVRTIHTELTPFYVQPDTVEAGAAVSLPIVLGTEIDKAENVYGVAFSIYYDPLLVRPESAGFVVDGWLGTTPEEIMAVYRDYHGFGRLDVALVRKDGQNITGFGPIGQLEVIIEDVIFRFETEVDLLLDIDNVRMINNIEETIISTPEQTTVLVENVTSVNEISALESIQIMPNPTKTSFTAKTTDAIIEKITIFNSKGQQQLLSKSSTGAYHVEDLPSGVYWLELQTNKGLAVRKLVKL